jgi:hypothetical protein
MSKIFKGESRLGRPVLEGDIIKVDQNREGGGWFSLVQDRKHNEFASCCDHCNEQYVAWSTENFRTCRVNIGWSRRVMLRVFC